MKNRYYKLMTSYNHCSIYTMYKMYINVDNKIQMQSDSLRNQTFKFTGPKTSKL